MRSLVSYPSHSATATFDIVTGTPDADFPASNLADLSQPCRVCKVSDVTGVVITAVLTETQAIRFIGLLNHNAAGATMVVKLYSDAAMTSLVHTSSAITLNDGDGGVYPACTPYLIDELNVRAVRLELDPGDWVIGAVEISGAWEFEDVQVDRSLGVDNTDLVAELFGGADAVTGQWAPRIFQGSRMIDVTEEETTALDFQNAKGDDVPYVWCWDYDDPDTWDRQCFIATNDELTPLSKRGHPEGIVYFGHREHL